MYTPLAIALVVLVIWSRRVQRRLPAEPWVGRVPLLVSAVFVGALLVSASDLMAMAQQRPRGTFARIAPWLVAFAESAGFVALLVYSLRPPDAPPPK